MFLTNPSQPLPSVEDFSALETGEVSAEFLLQFHSRAVNPNSLRTPSHQWKSDFQFL